MLQIVLVLLIVAMPGMFLIGYLLGRKSSEGAKESDPIQAHRAGVLRHCPAFRFRQQQELVTDVLKQLQTLFGSNNAALDPTLWDVMLIVFSLQVQYGWRSSLENVIQRLCYLVQRQRYEARLARKAASRLEAASSEPEQYVGVSSTTALSQ